MEIEKKSEVSGYFLFAMMGFIVGIIFLGFVDAYKESQGPFYMYSARGTKNGVGIVPIDFSKNLEIKGDSICLDQVEGRMCWKGNYLVTSPVPIQAFPQFKEDLGVLQISPLDGASQGPPKRF